MNCLEIEENKRVLEKFEKNITLYSMGLREIKYHLEKRNDIIKSFSENIEELQRYLQAAEILNDIMEKYVGYESIFDSLGELVDVKKVYETRPNEVITSLEEILCELNADDFAELEEISDTETELLKYKNKNIFKELKMLEELIMSSNYERSAVHQDAIDFENILKKFNNEDKLFQYSNLDAFCKMNIKGNVVIDKIIRMYIDYSSVETIAETNSFESMPLFSTYNQESLKPLLEYESEVYFRIINALNSLGALKDDLFNINSVEEQLMCINDLEKFLNNKKV